MKFKDAYCKKNDMNVLSEDFIKSLAQQMNIASQNTVSQGTQKKIHTDKEITGIVKCKKNKSIKYSSFAAAAAAVIVIFRFSALHFTNKFNIKTDSPVTKPSVTSDISDITTSSAPERDLSKYSENQAAVISAIDSLTLTDSPMAENYKTLDYQKLYSIYDNFEYNDDNNSFVFSSGVPDGDPWVESGQANYLDYHLYYKQSKCIPENLTEDDAVQYKRLLDYINTNVGADNYFIYDIYSYSFDSSNTMDTSSPGYTPTRNDSTECNYCIQIVLKEYINDYVKCNKYKYILDFEIKNDKNRNNTDSIKSGNTDQSEKDEFKNFSLDSLLTSQYEYFKETQPVADSLCAEFNSQYDNCTINVLDTPIMKKSEFSYKEGYDFLQSYSSYYMFTIPKALFIPYKSTCESEQTYSSTKRYMYNKSIYPEIITGTNLHDNISEISNYVSLFFKPDTPENDIDSQLKDMIPLLTKYNVCYFTVDILNSEKDFEYARKYKGYISEEVINSSFKKYYMIEDSNIIEGWPER